MYNFGAEHGQEVVDSLELTREYLGNASIIATPLLFFAPTTPFAAGFISAAGIMSLGAGGVESYLTQDMSYIKQEGISAGIGKVGGIAAQTYLKNAGAVTKVEYNGELGRYMGQYANGAYGIVKNTVGQASVVISEGTEQVLSFMTQKLWGN